MTQSRSMKFKTFAPALASLALFGAGSALAAETLSFPEIWTRVQGESKAVQASRHETESAKIAADQGGRHWLPRLYADVRIFSTNDPAASFFGILEQRQIQSSDFNPTFLNQPGSSVFQKATLGLQMPLFEGGSGVAQARSSEKMLDSKKMEEKATLTQQYLESAKSFGEISLIAMRRKELQNLRDLVDRTLERYKIGTRSNPVGYSGLLGLKTLKNRLNAVKLEFDSKSTGAFQRLDAIAGGLPANWRPEREDGWNVVEFADRYLGGSSEESSPRVSAAYAGAEAQRDAIAAERAKSLPQLGLFAEGNMNHGDRDTANSYTAGAYLSWEIFSPRSYGSANRARAQAEAAEARAQAAQRDEKSMRESMRASSKSLRTSIQLMHDSQDLLAEQSQMAHTLFANGSINVLQMVEVYARRLELIEALASAESNYLETRSAELASSGFTPSLSSGVKHE